MASAYFLNSQPGQISIKLNNGSAQILAGLNDQNNVPFCSYNIGPSPAKDVLGLGGVNTLTVTTNNIANNTNWTIKLAPPVALNTDIQFLVFVNNVVGRQNQNTQGFTITQTASAKMVKSEGSKRRKRAPY